MTADYWNRRRAAANAEANGITVTVPAYPGWSFKIGRMAAWCPDYNRAMARISARGEESAYLERFRTPGYIQTDADAALDARMAREAFAEGVMKDWTGVTGPDGKPMPFNAANAANLLEAFPDIFTELKTAAQDSARFEMVPTSAKKKAAAGN